jgi:phage repressor protein C with HTH and peptisase S24 domain
MTELEKIVVRIERRLKALGMKAATASRKAGLSSDAIRNMKRGNTKGTNAATLQKLAPVLETTAAWLLDEEGDEAAEPTEDRDTVPLVGYVSAGATMHFMPAGQLGTVTKPDNASKNTVAVEVRGDSLGPVFDRWIVYYDDVRRPITQDLIGKLCVVGLADGRVLIKQIKRAKKGHGFDLISQSPAEKPIRNVDIEWAGRVKQMMPR